MDETSRDQTSVLSRPRTMSLGEVIKKVSGEKKEQKYAGLGVPSSESGFQLTEILSILFNHIMVNLSDLVGKLCNRCQGWKKNVTKITIGLILHLTGSEVKFWI